MADNGLGSSFKSGGLFLAPGGSYSVPATPVVSIVL